MVVKDRCPRCGKKIQLRFHEMCHIGNSGWSHKCPECKCRLRLSWFLELPIALVVAWPWRVRTSYTPAGSDIDVFHDFVVTHRLIVVDQGGNCSRLDDRSARIDASESADCFH